MSVLSLSTDLSTESHGKLMARRWTTCSYDVKLSISQLFSANIVHIIVIWGREIHLQFRDFLADPVNSVRLVE